MCKQVIDFDQSTTTVKEERNNTLQWMNQISYYDPSCYIMEKFQQNLYISMSSIYIVEKFQHSSDHLIY